MIRAVEERIQKMDIPGTTHLSMGQEVADVSIISEYDNPFIFSNHRSHGQYLALTEDIEGLFKQLFEHKTQHLYKKGQFLCNGVQGGLAPVAVGLAYGFKRKGIKRRVLCFVGDGTTGQGVFYEALNLASIFDVPVTFIMYNNGYAMDKTVLHNNPHVWAEGMKKAFSIPVTHQHYINSTYGPELHVRDVPRLCGHSVNDTQVYRPKEERTQQWIDENDPMRYLIEQHPDLYNEVVEKVNKRIDEIADKQSTKKTD